MAKAWITLRHQPPYRSEAFANGFERLGYQPCLMFPSKGQVKPEDVVIVWNLNPRYRGAAREAKVAGAPVIVAENGYVRKRGNLEPYYALARDGHNGSGFWFVGEADRWAVLGHTLQAWVDRPDGYVLIAGQRGIGSDIMRSPHNFMQLAETRIKQVMKTAGEKRPKILHRPHPGRHEVNRSLKEDFEGARAVVTWSSNVANLALLCGIPAFRMAPYHVNDAVLDDMNLLPDPPRTDRLSGFRKLAWAQWSLSEVEQGTALDYLLQDVRKDRHA